MKLTRGLVSAGGLGALAFFMAGAAAAWDAAHSLSITPTMKAGSRYSMVKP